MMAQLSKRRLALYAAASFVLFAALFEVLSQLVMLGLQNSSANIILNQWRQEADLMGQVKEVHPIYGFHHKPNFVWHGKKLTNSMRMSQPEEVSIEKDPKKTRILCLGDSTTEGAIGRFSYPSSLQSILSEVGAQVEVINAGVNGWLSGQMMTWTHTELKDLKPDVVLLYPGWNEFMYKFVINNPSEEPIYTRRTWPWIFLQRGRSSFISLAEYLGLSLRKVTQRDRQMVYLTDEVYFESQDDIWWFYRDLESTFGAFRNRNPNVKIIVGLLASPLPMSPPSDFHGTWNFISETGLTPEHVRKLLDRFNEVNKVFYKNNRVVIIDPRGVLEKTKTPLRIFSDLSHLTAEGYQMLARQFSKAILNGGEAER
ncbi:MAG: SGNH/GDSL hydrolase family protein [Oligoflexia bacterium]|nr:SGNH/GDSL hydrolase family protein [Oligoflexia bacterium]